MFFYTSLFVACVIVALLIVYLFNAVANAGRAFYGSFLPSSKDKFTGQHARTRYHSTRNAAPAPWGWKGNGSVIREHGPNAATMSGNSGLDAFINDHGKKPAATGWPHREEKTEFAGSSYKVSRKAGSSSKLRSSRGKPWGW